MAVTTGDDRGSPSLSLSWLNIEWCPCCGAIAIIHGAQDKDSWKWAVPEQVIRKAAERQADNMTPECEQAIADGLARDVTDIPFPAGAQRFTGRMRRQIDWVNPPMLLFTGQWVEGYYVRTSDPVAGNPQLAVRPFGCPQGIGFFVVAEADIDFDT